MHPAQSRDTGAPISARAAERAVYSEGDPLSCVIHHYLNCIAHLLIIAHTGCPLALSTLHTACPLYCLLCIQPVYTAYSLPIILFTLYSETSNLGWLKIQKRPTFGGQNKLFSCAHSKIWTVEAKRPTSNFQVVLY